LSPQVQRYLKDALDPVTNLPSRCIVVGTSNSLANLDEALVERFRCIEYRADQEFATLCRSKILNLINTVMEPAYRAGLSRPPIVSQWGQKGDRFSMREAIKNAEDFLRTENTRVSNLAQRR